MNWLRSLLGRHRKPQVQKVQLVFTADADKVLYEFMRKNIRPHGSKPGDWGEGVSR